MLSCLVLFLPAFTEVLLQLNMNTPNVPFSMGEDEERACVVV